MILRAALRGVVRPGPLLRDDFVLIWLYLLFLLPPPESLLANCSRNYAVLLGNASVVGSASGFNNLGEVYIRYPLFAVLDLFDVFVILEPIVLFDTLDACDFVSSTSTTFENLESSTTFEILDSSSAFLNFCSESLFFLEARLLLDVRLSFESCC